MNVVNSSPVGHWGRRYAKPTDYCYDIDDDDDNDDDDAAPVTVVKR